MADLVSGYHQTISLVVACLGVRPFFGGPSPHGRLLPSKSWIWACLAAECKISIGAPGRREEEKKKQAKKAAAKKKEEKGFHGRVGSGSKWAALLKCCPLSVWVGFRSRIIPNTYIGALKVAVEA